MTKWDTIQGDILPITPKYWGDEISDNEIDEQLEKDLEDIYFDDIEISLNEIGDLMEKISERIEKLEIGEMIIGEAV